MTTTPAINLTNEQIDLIAKKYAGMGGVEDYRSFARDIVERMLSDVIDSVRTEALRAAARVADAEHNEFREAAARNNGRESDFAFGSVNSAERIGKAIRQLNDVPVDSDTILEKAALICDRTGRRLVDAPATALFECAENIRKLKSGSHEKVVATKDAIEAAANIVDSAGHHWSGRPALIMFDCATEIRGMERTGVEEGAE